jgi:hypothetical protein
MPDLIGHPSQPKSWTPDQVRATVARADKELINVDFYELKRFKAQNIYKNSKINN